MADGLKIRIGADTQALQSGLNQATVNLKKFGANAVGVSSNLSQLANSSALAGTEVGDLTNSFAGASGPIGIAAIALVALGVELVNYKSISEQAKETQKAVNLEIQKSVASTAGEVAELKSLVAIATDAELSTKARAEAQNQLNKLYPDTFRNYNFEKADLGQLKKLTDDLIVSIQNHAKAKALQSQIDASADRVLEIQNQKLGSNLSILDKIRIAIIGGANTQLAITKSLVTSIGNQNESLKEEDTLQKTLAAQLTEVNKQLAVNGDLYNDKPQKIKKQADAITDLTEKIKRLNLVLGVQDERQVRIDAQNGPTVKGKAVGAPVVKDFSKQFIDSDTALSQLLGNAKAAAEIFNSTLGPAITSAFTAAIEGTKSFGEAFGQAIKNIIVQLIATIAKALILAAILSAIFPASKGGLGFLGSFKDLLSGGKGFAGGGVAEGPKSGYFALLHGKETIFNESQMKALGNLISNGGGNSGGVLSASVRGEDLIFLLDRTQNRRGRNF